MMNSSYSLVSILLNAFLLLFFVKADFHSVQNVARSTFSERFLLNYKQASGTNLISCG